MKGGVGGNLILAILVYFGLQGFGYKVSSSMCIFTLFRKILTNEHVLG